MARSAKKKEIDKKTRKEILKDVAWEREGRGYRKEKADRDKDGEMMKKKKGINIPNKSDQNVKEE